MKNENNDLDIKKEEKIKLKKSLKPELTFVFILLGTILLGVSYRTLIMNKIDDKKTIDEYEPIDISEPDNKEENNGKKFILYKALNEDLEVYYGVDEDIESKEERTKIGEFVCASETCSVMNISNDGNYYAFNDNETITIYNLENNKIVLKEHNNNSWVSFALNSGKTIGVFIKENNIDSKYVSFINNKMISLGNFELITVFNNKIASLSVIDNKYLAFFDLDDESTKLLDINTNKIDKVYKNEKFYINTGYDFIMSMITSNESIEDVKYKLYNTKLDSLSSKTYIGNNIQNDVFVMPYKEEVIFYNKNDYFVYNPLTKQGREYTLKNEIFSILTTNLFVSKNKDNELILINREDEILKVIGEVDYKYIEPISGRFEAHGDKPAGIYIVFRKGETSSEKCFEYYYNETTKGLKKYDLEYCGGYAKPVLYLYPTKKTKVTVNFEKENMLTTTYPKFINEWNVIAHPNGDLYDTKGNYYYGLYWEEKENHKVNFNEGFYVTKENAIKFLEDKLTTIGLNPRERNEFIMYWLPILEKNEKSLVYFELTEERENYNKIQISPKPDSLLRIAIHVKKVNNEIRIKEQQLPEFKRTGFTAVEWGGVKYN